MTMPSRRFSNWRETEGIIPALESSHAIAYGTKLAQELGPDGQILINLSGRGDKDVDSVARYIGAWKRVPKLASRIAEAFDRIRAEKRTGLVTYVTAGDPDMARSADILYALDRAGADVLEVGIPFSEPLADGPVIQRATERALAAGATASGVLDLVKRVRSDGEGPDRAVHLRQSSPQDGHGRVRRSRP